MRAVRVDDDSWEMVRLRAQLEDRPIASVIRAAIRQYFGVRVGEVGQQKGGNAWEAEEPDVVNQGPASPVSSTRFGTSAVYIGNPEGDASEIAEPVEPVVTAPSVMPKPARRVPERPSGPCSHPKSARKMVNGGPFCAPSLGGCGATL